MAKAPQPGRCKTRLLSRLTPDEAAALSAAFLRDVTGNLQAASRTVSITPYVAYAPDGTAPLFDGMLAPGTTLILADGTASCPPSVQGFGRCLLHAVHTMLDRGHTAACVLNADSPTLPTRVLSTLAELLAQPGDRAVLGPAEDGGYYALGLKHAHAHLFADIAWSTDRVAAQTQARARDIGLDLILLPAWYDVDEPAALDRLTTALDDGSEPGAYPAPATRAVLKQLASARLAAADS